MKSNDVYTRSLNKNQPDISHRNYLYEAFVQSGFALSDDQLVKFLSYYDLLIEWNGRMNLTGITKFEDVVEKHFLDSVLCAKEMDFNHIHSMVDIGTGAGFPGIPLKIMFPDMKVVLLDSLEKRVRFLNEVITTLSLQDTEALHGRAETLARKPELRENFDLAVTRAVAPLSVILEYCMPFVAVDGQFAAYKGPKADEELAESFRAIAELQAELDNTIKFELPASKDVRNILVFRKKDRLSEKYPRRDGVPAKKPL